METLANRLLPPALHIDKGAPSGHARLSNWRAFPLTDEQIHYAAMDAFLSYWIFSYALAQPWRQNQAGMRLTVPDDYVCTGTATEPLPRAAADDSNNGGADTRSGGATGSSSNSSSSSSDAHADFYIMHRNRSIAPPARGVKPHPQGAPHALAGQVCIISGVLDSFSREEMSSYIKMHGGRVVKAMSRKVTVLLNDHGEVGKSKRAKCGQWGIPIESEDYILQRVGASIKS